jgi:hypothetical protein
LWKATHYKKWHTKKFTQVKPSSWIIVYKILISNMMRYSAVNQYNTIKMKQVGSWNGISQQITKISYHLKAPHRILYYISVSLSLCTVSSLDNSFSCHAQRKVPIFIINFISDISSTHSGSIGSTQLQIFLFVLLRYLRSAIRIRN